MTPRDGLCWLGLAALGALAACDRKSGEATVDGASWFTEDTGAAGADTDAAPTWPCTVGPVPLCINEIMADNRYTTTDETGAASDWIELVNLGEAPLSLEGYGLADDLEEPEPFRLGAGLEIAGGGFLLLWADGSPELGAQHLDFKLDAEGEAVLLYDPDGRAVDLIHFGGLPADQSAARLPDGGADWALTTAATPGASNGEAR